MPSSPAYIRNYKQEDANDTPARKQARSDRNKARRIAEAYYGAAAIQGKDIDHITPVSKGGRTVKSNLRIATPAANRSFQRNSNGGLVSQISSRERKK